MTDYVEVRRTPTEGDIRRMVDAGKRAVAELVTVDGSLGGEEIARRYMMRLYEAITAKAALAR